MSETLTRETAHFWTTGEDMTAIIRDMWSSNLVDQALEICTDGGMSNEDGVKLCTGKLKLVGDTREGDHTLQVQEDNTATYFTLEKQLEQLEEKFIYHTDHVSFLKRQMELGMLPTAGASMYRKSASGHSQYAEDERLREKALKDAKKALAGLSILYPMVGKTLLDIPFEKLGQMFSTPESHEYERAWNQVHENVARRRYKEDEEIDKILGEDRPKRKPITPDTANFYTFHHGWLSPTGDFFGCGYAGHKQLAADLEEAKFLPESDDPTKAIDSLGWMKLQDSKFVQIAHDKYIMPTQIQIDRVIDYCTAKHEGKIHYNFHVYDTTEDFLEHLEEEKGYL